MIGVPSRETHEEDQRPGAGIFLDQVLEISA